MAEKKNIKVLSIKQEWQQTQNGEYTNYETEGAVDGRDPGQQMPVMIQVGSQGMTQKMLAGETYMGRFVGKKENGMWLVAFMAKDNESLAAPQQEGYGGQPSREQTDEPRKPASEGPQRPVAASGGGKGYDGVGLVAAALTGAVAISIARNSNGVVDFDDLASVAQYLMDIGQELIDTAQPAPAKEDGMNPAMAEALMKEITPVISNAGLAKRYDESDVADMDVIKLWQECQKNQTKFAIQLNDMLAGGVKQADTTEDGEGDPDSDIPF